MTRIVGGMRWLAITLVLSVVVAACDQGPAPNNLKSDLEAVIDVIVPPGLLTLQSVSVIEMKRAGGDAEPGQRAVRFIALAKLNRDVDFSAWDQFSIGALANAFGTLPEDIGGIGARGNAAGEVLTIPGTAIYDQDSNLSPPWRLHALRPMDQPLEKSPEFSYVRQLIALAVSSPNAWKIISDNAHWPPVRALALLARAKGGFAIASGPPDSDRWRLVEALREDQAPLRPVINVARESAAADLALLRDGTVTAAVVDNDTVDMAVRGEGPFAAAGPYKNLRAVASLYPKPVHVITSAASQVNSVTELRDKRIVVVNDGLGATKIVDDVLRAYRLANATPEPTTVPNLGDALKLLADGKTDAVIAVGTAPQSGLAVATATHGFRLVPLDSDAIALLTSGDTHYLATSIPGRTYRGQQNAVATVAAAAVLVADKSAPQSEIRSLLQCVFGPVAYLRNGSTAGMMIKPSTALVGLPVPLHAGAVTIYDTPSP